MENTTILTVHHLCKNYPQFSLSDISFSLEKGSIMGLIGENGAGKSTTMKMFLGLTRPSSGSFKIGVVFDELPFVQTMFTSHLGKVMKGIYQNWDQQTYEQYLKQFGLPDKKELKDFSRGMKMKLSLAVALSHKAKLLILDEPTSGLDPVVRAEILDLFLDFISDGERSVLVSSHITSDLEKVADYITFIHNGRLMLCENKDDILYGYGIAKADQSTIGHLDSELVLKKKNGKYGSQALVREKEEFLRRYPDILVDPINLDELMLMLCSD